MVYMTAFQARIRRSCESSGGQEALMLAYILKQYTKTLVLFLNNTDILHTGFEIKHEIICMSHPYRTKQQIIDTPKMT